MRMIMATDMIIRDDGTTSCMHRVQGPKVGVWMFWGAGLLRLLDNEAGRCLLPAVTKCDS